MKELLDKLSSYNIFNYLLPGVLFAAIADRFTSYSFITENLLVGFFVYYFLGLVISRIGSLFLEPFLKKIRFLKFAPYEEYVQSSKMDDKLEELSESNNMYRTLTATFFCLLGLFGLDAITKTYPLITGGIPVIICSVLVIIFVFSYRKQTKYIKDRIVISNQSKGSSNSQDLKDDQ